MKRALAQRLQFCSLLALVLCAWMPGASAQGIPVRYVQGTMQGSLDMRSEDGKLLASGDSTQVVHDGQVTARTIFSFKDGSIDDETTVFSQRGSYRLFTDRRVQKGPTFPHPMDVLIDARSGQVTVRTTGKHGKDAVKTYHLNLPPDLANGMVPLIIENLPPGAVETTVPMLVLAPKPLLVKLLISPDGEQPFSVAGSPRKAIHYEIKIQIGGVAGVLAPLVGKAPPNIELWIIGGLAPTFLREQGPIYPEGPIMTIELAGPVWPKAPKAGS